MTLLPSSFLVVDTEGNPYLTEIALVDSGGKLIYAGTVSSRLSLSGLIQQAQHHCRDHALVFHNAEHDRRIIAKSCQQVGITWELGNVQCTYKMARSFLPQVPDYSLEYLSKHLNLKVKGKRFNDRFAHSASYDALFTHQLFCQLRTMQPLNPFINNHVDNPFQNQLDFAAIFAQEFSQLSTILQEVRAEPNHQSRGVVVIGEPGTGKTHLMMRLAKSHLKTNRILFIRYPNNPASVFYHTYCRVLESLAENIPDTAHNQLEYLLANTFFRILQRVERVARAVKGQALLRELEQNRLSLFSKIAKDANKNRTAWDYIEENTLTWWAETYGVGGFGTAILKGITRFCRYSDIKKRETVQRWLAGQSLSPEECESVSLPDWKEEVGQESFALDGLKVLGRLSTLDEPLIFVFDQLEVLWLRHHESLPQAFGHAIKEIITHVPNSLVILNLYPDRWQEFCHTVDDAVIGRITDQVRLTHPSADQLRDILRLRSEAAGMNLDHLFTPRELTEVLAQPSIRWVLKRASQYFQHKQQNIPLPEIEVLSPPTGTPPAGLEARVSRLEKLIESLLSDPLEANPIEGHPTAVDPLDMFFEHSSEEVTPIETNPSAADPLEMFSDHSSKTPPVEDEPMDKEFFTSSHEDEVREYLQVQRKQLEADYTKLNIVADSDDLGKLITIVEAFQADYEFEIEELRLGKQKVPDNLLLRWQTKSYAIGFLHASANTFTPRIKNWNELVGSYPDTHFYLLRDGREPSIRSAVGGIEIERLRHSPNGNFMVMDKENRISFELCYRLVVDIKNRDLEVSLAQGVEGLITFMPAYWLIQILSSDRIR